MPTLKKAKFRSDEIVIAISSFATQGVPGQGTFSVAAGSRWRGGHPVVKGREQFFCADATPTDEIARLRQELEREAEQEPIEEPVRTRVERLDDEDAMIAVTGLGAGTRAHKKSEAVRSAADGLYVPVADPKVKRADALVATATLSQIAQDGTTRVVYAGQWVHRDDELVRIHPHSFVMPPARQS